MINDITQVKLLTWALIYITNLILAVNKNHQTNEAPSFQDAG